MHVWLTFDCLCRISLLQEMYVFQKKLPCRPHKILSALERSSRVPAISDSLLHNAKLYIFKKIPHMGEKVSLNRCG